jgi:fumarate reductase flavoprotein subunit
MGVAAGGYLRGRQNYLSNFGGVMADASVPSAVEVRPNHYPERRQPWEIYVNANGRRFVREDIPSVDAREHALLDQPDLRYWIVFDEAIRTQSPPLFEGWSPGKLLEAFDDHDMFYRSDTLADLASRAGIGADNLVRTVARFNQGVLTGQDLFGRRHNPLAIVKPPFYAIRVQGYSSTSTVGLAVDPQLRVIRQDGTPIPNLYAAGELLGSGQTMGRAACGGMMITPALTFGRMLGQRLLPLDS